MEEKVMTEYNDLQHVSTTPPDHEEWIHCPICGHKTRTKLHRETVLINFPLFCRKCKNTILINAQDGRISIIE